LSLPGVQQTGRNVITPANLRWPNCFTEQLFYD
jgi:hypothetical protein